MKYSLTGTLTCRALSMFEVRIVAHDGLGVYDWPAVNDLAEFLPAEPTDLDAFIVHGLLLALGQLFREIHRHAFIHIARTCKESSQLGPFSSLVSSLLAQLPFGRGQRGLTGIQPASW